MSLKEWVWRVPAWVRFEKYVCVRESGGVGVLFHGCVGNQKVVIFPGEGYGVWDVGGGVNPQKRVGLVVSGLWEVLWGNMCVWVGEWACGAMAKAASRVCGGFGGVGVWGWMCGGWGECLW